MRVAFYTLGCKVNHYETAAMEELFSKAGHRVVAFEEAADAYIINTCTVTQTADKKSRQMIARAHTLNPEAPILAVGCYAELGKEQVSKLPGVKLVLGTDKRRDIVPLTEEAVLGNSLPLDNPPPFQRRSFEELSAVADSRTRASLKIQDGCVSFCSYCAIPYARGALRSRSLESCKKEFTALKAAGYKEVVLVGIQLSAYGKDLKDGSGLIDVMELSQACGIERLRLGSLDPMLINDDFVHRAAKLPNLCRQFHLALQSGDDGVLRAMNRPYTTAVYRREVALLRAAMPDCAITTDIIAGFPGETLQQQQQTLDFVKEIGFARIHVFPYSRRKGTKADSLPGQLTKKEKEERAKALITLGDSLEEAFVQSLVGSQQWVLMEEDGSGYTGNYVRVVCAAPEGTLARVKITGRDGKLALGIPII